MHILIGIGVVAGLIAFAFGPNAAKIFVGGILALCVAGLLAAVTWVAVDVLAPDDCAHYSAPGICGSWKTEVHR